MRVKGWYFSTTEKRLLHGDNRQIVKGCLHKHKGSLCLCKIGLHFSKDILDALRYAPGPVIWRVEGSGDMINSFDKVVCSERKYINGGIDITDILWKFAREDCALSVIHLWNAPEVVRQFLETGDESLRDTARWAAMEVTGNIVTTTARDAAAYAASAVNENQVPVAVWASARDALWAKGKYDMLNNRLCWHDGVMEARSKLSNRLTRLVRDRMGESNDDSNSN